ncbi:MAG: DUF3833 domain-containing protein [Alphaproteobacteria bacterium]|nr:DUF3833 domain-containing protein [Alphaproteobacteria bacterium]
MQVEEFSAETPRLVLEEYFSGKTKAWGIVEDRFGKVRRRFVVDIDGTWQDGELTLVEDFVYDDGEEEQRIWRIKKLDDNSYEGRADDVVGPAKGKAFGNALNWQYTLALKMGDSVWNVRFDDWMFLQDCEVMINRARISKFGIELGQVTLFFRKLDGAHGPDCRDNVTSLEPSLRRMARSTLPRTGTDS